MEKKLKGLINALLSESRELVKYKDEARSGACLGYAQCAERLIVVLIQWQQHTADTPKLKE